MGRRSRGRNVAAMVLLGALVGLPGPILATHAAAQGAAPVRILILGDSATQGSSGDWTWRFWLWRALRRSGVAFDFVGPRDDLYDAVRHQQGSHDYATTIDGKYPNFDRDHGARWGMALATPDQSMTSLMTAYHPDVVIEARGLVDVAWRGRSAAEVDELLADEVTEARVVDPGVDFVITELPQQWRAGVDAYNATLEPLAEVLSLPGSGVVTSDSGQGFTKGVDTWDANHFSATGEVRMASAVEDALAALGVGPGASTPPTVRNGHWGAAQLAARAGDRSATLRWSGPAGIPEQVLWIRRPMIEQWTKTSYRLSGSSWVVDGLVAGEPYDFRLQAVKGGIRADAVSNVVRVVPLPQAPRRPASVAVAAGSRRLTVTWRPVAGATSYEVAWVGRTTRGHGKRVVRTGPVTIKGLVAGARYDVTVTARNAGGRGLGATVVGLPGS